MLQGSVQNAHISTLFAWWLCEASKGGGVWGGGSPVSMLGGEEMDSVVPEQDFIYFPQTGWDGRKPLGYLPKEEMPGVLSLGGGEGR